MATQSLSLKVIRPDDLLVLRLDFIDVDVTPGTPPTIGGQPGARLVVHFQPQHVAEEAFWESGKSSETKEEKAARNNPPPAPPAPAPPAGSDPLPDAGRARSRLAGASRLAFTIPTAVSFPLSLPEILEAIKRLPLHVPGVAAYETPAGCAGVPAVWLPLFLRPAPPKIAPPAPLETAIEAPYRLFLSPDSLATWDHSPDAVEHDGRVELWHTRLGSRRASRDPRVRAVWSPDFMASDLQTHSNEPFRSALDGRDRNEIVHLTSNYHLDTFAPLSVDTRRFMLTTLGVWLDLQGDWSPPLFGETRSLTVEQWRHLATMGRDHYVRVVYAGYLFPFGHRASLVKITERKFSFRDATGFVAYNFQRMFILVRERSRSYTPRDMPFRELEITTRATPDLEKPEASSVIAPPSQEAFWPRITLPDGSGTEFQFHVIGRDWEQRETEFTTPLIFVSKDADLSIDPVVTAYNKAATIPLRRSRMNGRRVSFAPVAKPGDTALEATTITFAASKLASVTPHFRPLMAEAEVDLPAVKQLLDKSVPSVIEYEPTYLGESGNAIGNAGDVFARIKPGPKIAFAHEKSGGLLAPDMSITSVSRSLGAMGGTPTDIVKGLLNPADVFKGVKLFGGIELADIIAPLVTTNASTDAGGKFPELLTVREANAIRTSYTWTVLDKDLRKVPTGIFQPENGSIVLTAVARKPLDGGAPTFVTSGTLSNFGIVLLPGAKLATLRFDFIKFTAEAGKKLDTAVQFKGIEFDGILKFVNELQKVIPMDGFNDPPSVQLMTSPPGVNVGFSLGLPSIGIGVMTMQNISLSASFYLPLIGDQLMNFRFAFCERHQPFTLTVSLFGGGGFFAINMGILGVVSIEASLEFGASIALNLGVASGQATIMAGFYFKMSGSGFSLTGYFRACGSLSVLGIISVSVEFYLGLTYTTKGMIGEPHPGKLWGQATLTVKIKIVFFSISVGISMERVFAGSDPTFRQLMAPDDWASYCLAFDDDYPVVVGE